jgi:hypothetical protein
MFGVYRRNDYLVAWTGVTSVTLLLGGTCSTSVVRWTMVSACDVSTRSTVIDRSAISPGSAFHIWLMNVRESILDPIVGDWLSGWLEMRPACFG